MPDLDPCVVTESAVHEKPCHTQKSVHTEAEPYCEGKRQPKDTLYNLKTFS